MSSPPLSVLLIIFSYAVISLVKIIRLVLVVNIKFFVVSVYVQDCLKTAAKIETIHHIIKELFLVISLGLRKE